MKKDNVVSSPLFIFPSPNFNIGKTAHAESQEVSTALCQGRRGKRDSIIVIFMTYILSTLFWSNIVTRNLSLNLHDNKIRRFMKLKQISLMTIANIHFLIICVM